MHETDEWKEGKIRVGEICRWLKLTMRRRVRVPEGNGTTMDLMVFRNKNRSLPLQTVQIVLIVYSRPWPVAFR